MSDERGLDGLVLDSTRLIKRGYSAIIKNAGKAIAVITAAIAVLVSFTEISFLDTGTKELTASALFLLVASYIIFFSLVSAGRQLGRESEEYRAAYASFREVAEMVTGADLGALRTFISRFQKEELKARRGGLLLELDLTEEEYIALTEKKKPTRAEKKILRRISSERPVNISAHELLSVSASERGRCSYSRGARLISLLLKLVPTTLCALFTVSVMLGVRENMSFSMIAEALVRLSTLPIVALKGYTAGYEEVVSLDVELYDTRRRLLTAFLESREECQV